MERTLDKILLDPASAEHAHPGAIDHIGIALDYSSGVPDPAKIKAQSYLGVIRYLPKRGGSGVVTLTRAEYQNMIDHGLGVALFYEDKDPARAGQGRAAGITDGPWAIARAKDCGIVQPRGMYFTVDYDAEPAAIAPYFQGLVDTIGLDRTWVYGSARVVTYLFERGLASKAVQARAWSHGVIASGISAYQDIDTVVVDGIVCDPDYIFTEDWGQHPAPHTPGGGIDLAGISQEEFNRLMDNWSRSAKAFPPANHPRVDSLAERIAARNSAVFRMDFMRRIVPYLRETIAQRTTTVVGTDARRAYRLDALRTKLAGQDGPMKELTTLVKGIQSYLENVVMKGRTGGK